ncbi:CAP domain-containing protein [Candidatus Desulforudis audaxviator]|uniref:Allergen V5/Tpx-1 family protein n=1 Tax=Desulforudis audaxviator (strain MP104C) TaxID=477974 RepID=B1I121_DESAP|nr:CAP domain-containing protein [Candidatus Desulforudis audaxviator]ACA58620.1 Allergen V5/Tpx-1 family protein [Candidatus Desulforudis audaxviator MP104C]AZK58619.1 Transporter [Candidatus Desulforudis audaxviator]
MQSVNKKLAVAVVALMLSVALLIPATLAHANAPSAEESKLITGINQARQKAGVQLLTNSARLNEVALTLLTNGTSVSLALREQGITYRSACTLRVGSGNADLVVRALTGYSSSQVLQPQYNQIGVAIRNNTTVIVLINGVIAAQPAPQTAPTPAPQPAPSPAPMPSPGPSGLMTAYEMKIVELVNAERAKLGLRALAVDAKLSQVARLKSEDMRDKRYFAHQSPTYGSPFDMMRQFGITYRTAGENIAAGQRTPEEAMRGWMNSSGHRANILNPNFTHIGVGHVVGGSYGNYWTQMFIGR